MTRDDLMLELAEKYPEYGFEIHKGYGTKAHYAALSNVGVIKQGNDRYEYAHKKVYSEESALADVVEMIAEVFRILFLDIIKRCQYKLHLEGIRIIIPCHLLEFSGEGAAEAVRVCLFVQLHKTIFSYSHSALEQRLLFLENEVNVHYYGRLDATLGRRVNSAAISS